MKRAIGLGVAASVILALPALAAESSRGTPIRHHHAYRHLHRAAQSQSIAPSATAEVPPPAPAPIVFPGVAPYPNGKGDEDGLSRDINDCNKGCIGGNPG